MKNKPYTLEEVKKITGWDDIVSFKQIEEKYWEVTHEDECKILYSLDFKEQLTFWYKSIKQTKEKYWEVTYNNRNKILYSKDFKKQLTWWFKGDYFIEDKKIFKIIKKQIGEIE